MYKYDVLQLEKALGPYKYMKNPPAFESPVLEPNILLQQSERVELPHSDADRKRSSKKWWQNASGYFAVWTCVNVRAGQF